MQYLDLCLHIFSNVKCSVRFIFQPFWDICDIYWMVEDNWIFVFKEKIKIQFFIILEIKTRAFYFYLWKALMTKYFLLIITINLFSFDRSYTLFSLTFALSNIVVCLSFWPHLCSVCLSFENKQNKWISHTKRWHGWPCCSSCLCFYASFPPGPVHTISTSVIFFRRLLVLYGDVMSDWDAVSISTGHSLFLL